jgi:CelD/BcsL family acetyltransferase involved in cellulose biosynthesis
MKENANNYVNRLRRNGHREELVVMTEPSQLDAAVDLFLRMHKTRAEADLKTHRDRFSTAQTRDFLRRVAPRLQARERIWPAVLKIDGQPVAAQLWLLLEKRAYRYYSGFDPAWARLGVMTVLTRRCIERAIENEFTELDLLLSLTDPQEKARWGASPRPVHTLTVGNGHLRSRLALRGYRARTRASERQDAGSSGQESRSPGK